MVSAEVITSAEFHPIHCNMLAYSSSKGSIRLIDMRQSALCDSHTKLFEEPEAPGSRSFFTEIIASISDIKFSKDGRYILSRDYMTLKLWDINMDSGPVASYQVHEHLRPKLCDLYENDSIFDKFECCLSGDGLRVATGSYRFLLACVLVNVEHLDRFNAEFGCEDESDDDDEKTSKNGKSTTHKSSKPSDWQALFGEKNSDDEFMLGIKHTRKSIRLYGDFYSSDMIIASPLKLHMAIGQAEENKERDVDYLSSIEVLIIDHADIISMQNWSFLATVVDHINRLPTKQHGTNVMRIRPLYLDGQARFYRQSIILSSYLTPEYLISEMNGLFNRQCLNYKGKVGIRFHASPIKLACEYKGVLEKVLLPVRQIYERFDADSMTQADNARLEYFTKKIFPKIKDSVQGGVMIFIPSYYDFVRVRNYLKSQNASFCLLGDYTKNADISRAREWFFAGSRKIMLYTERAYFYRRYKIRGIKNLIFYSLPERKEFYPEVNVEHLDRFNAEFGCEDESDDDDEKTSKNGKSTTHKSSKPSDWQALFGEKNSDDEFMLGIKHTRKSIRLYGDFYSSDMIIASPLKLHMAIGQAEENKERDVDYLSSIEVLIIDHADIISMQNWSFLATVVDHINRLPTKQHGTNVMRIRPLYLDGQSRFYRQSIILSSYLTPGIALPTAFSHMWLNFFWSIEYLISEMNGLFNRQCLNYKGKVGIRFQASPIKLACEYKGVLEKVLLPVRQIYERFDADSMTQADNARLEYFTKKIFPKIKDSVQGGVMIFIPSYYDFVRVRNYLKSQNASFCLLGDYTKNADISRAREWFFAGSRKIMLYTERAYFYRRYKIRGIKNLIFYSLPERKEFYPEIMNMLDEGSYDMMSTALFSRFDLLKMERIVGTAYANRMICSDKSIFAFC
ncbi:hypothetical protein F2Q68_00040832 [Brassica cretica]|uniref:U3 small nucleolar RNA-associated protein 25 n=1 Tax=Brassica cretica TaxID=69181 RepID=A0A8S9MKK1_BRACR|nr:hypothetical protein F2Q68_00040832 [Brassica cretica]